MGKREAVACYTNSGPCSPCRSQEGAGETCCGKQSEPDFSRKLR